MISISAIEKAHARVRGFFEPSPLSYSPFLSERLGDSVELYCKWDNRLRTGSFKERGVIEFLSSLTDDEKKKGVIAASAGNHAIALAFYTNKMGITCEVIMPTWAPLVKVRTAEKYKASVRLSGISFQESYDLAIQEAKARDLIFVSAFNDERIITGQGTAGVEILSQIRDPDLIIVPVGGGGLISGIASFVKQTSKKVKIIGVQSAWAVQARNEAHGNSNTPKNPFPPSSIADGIAVKTIGSITKPYIDAYVDDMVTVTEDEIAAGIIAVLETEKTVLEGAGAAVVAALLANKIPNLPSKVVAMCCGSNIDLDLVSRLLMRDLVKKERACKLVFSVPDRPGSLRFITDIVSQNGANVLEVLHDRNFAEIPGAVSITLLLELKTKAHKSELMVNLLNAGLLVKEV